MASEPATIESLPGEILISILSSLSTPSLLPLAAINRRIHAIVLRLLHYRLVQVATHPHHQLILECYHPTAVQTTPTLDCDYLGTDGLDRFPASHNDGCTSRVTGAADFLSLAEARQLYSHYRPVKQPEGRRPRARYPRRLPVVSSPTALDETSRGHAVVDPPEPDPPFQDLHLDENELFSQLVTVTNLLKRHPTMPAWHISHVNVGDGVVRVWRDWLAERAAAATAGLGMQPLDEEAILWADTGKNVGLRFRVIEKMDMHRPLLVTRHEDPPVSYRLEYQEMLVRTNQLLLAKERSEMQEVTDSGTALVIAPI